MPYNIFNLKKKSNVLILHVVLIGLKRATWSINDFLDLLKYFVTERKNRYYILYIYSIIINKTSTNILCHPTVTCNNIWHENQTIISFHLDIKHTLYT